MTFYDSMTGKNQDYGTDHPPLSRKGAATRARILDSARTMLVQTGYDGVVMRSVAAQAKMTLGNLQHYFPTREALLAAVVQAEADSDLEDLRRQRAGTDTPERVFRASVQTLIRKWRGESGKILALLGFLALHLPHFRVMYRHVYEQFYDELAQTIGALVPGLDRRECLRRARLVTALLDGAAQQVSRGGSAGFLEQVTREALRIAGAPHHRSR